MTDPSDPAASSEQYDDSGSYEPYGGSDYFTLDFYEVGERGGFHVRNQPGQKQRPTVSSFRGGSSTRPKYSVNCLARAIIHGTLDPKSHAPATLLIYDLSFLSYHSTRLKDAQIFFEFKDDKGNGMPEVYKIAPYMKHTTMASNEVHHRTLEAGIGGGAGLGPVSIIPNISASNRREKTTEYQVEVIGDKPGDDHGLYYQAQWFLKENESQKNGIGTFFRVCILLKRQHNGQFLMRPTIKATADTATRFLSLFAARSLDDPVVFDPSLEPYGNGIDSAAIDRKNLSAVDMDGLWDWTFYNVFSRGIKVS